MYRIQCLINVLIIWILDCQLVMMNFYIYVKYFFSGVKRWWMIGMFYDWFSSFCFVKWFMLEMLVQWIGKLNIFFILVYYKMFFFLFMKIGKCWFLFCFMEFDFVVMVFILLNLVILLCFRYFCSFSLLFIVDVNGLFILGRLFQKQWVLCVVDIFLVLIIIGLDLRNCEMFFLLLMFMVIIFLKSQKKG